MVVFTVCLLLFGCAKSAAVQNFDKIVANIGEVTIDSGPAISAAEETMNLLSDEDQSAALESIQKLKTMRNQYDELVKAIEVENLITAIGEVSVDSLPKIAAAREAYDALSPVQQSSVTNVNILLSAEKQFDQVASTKTMELISDIGTVTLESQQAIAAARELYNSLSLSQQQKVSNLSTLEAAEQQLASLIEEQERQALSEALDNFEITEDIVENVTYYRHKKMPTPIVLKNSETRYGSASFVMPYILVEGNEPTLVTRIYYTGDDWIFMENATVVSGDYKDTLSIPYSDVIRAIDRGVAECYDYKLPANAGEDAKGYKMLVALTDSQDAIVRLQGSEFHYDHTISESEQQVIRETLALYRSLLK